MSYGAPNPFTKSVPPFPGNVLVARIIWIVFGSLIVAYLVVTLLLMLGAPLAARGDSLFETVVCTTILIGFFGAAFILVGVQSVKGTARDTLGNGIGSIIFGVLYLAGAAFQAIVGQPIQGAFTFVAGCGLIAAGVFALVGRNDYKAWRQAARS